MKSLREKNLKKLKDNHVYSEGMEHDACGVGLVVSTEGKKSRKVVESGIEALKAVWHRGAIDADGKTGDGAGIHIEIPVDFFVEKIEVTGHTHDRKTIRQLHVRVEPVHRQHRWMCGIQVLVIRRPM